MPVAATAAAVYEHAQAECVVCVLMHKVREAGREGGLQPARQLLQDWLVRALAKYNLHKKGGQHNPTAVQVGSFVLETTICERAEHEPSIACSLHVCVLSFGPKCNLQA